MRYLRHSSHRVLLASMMLVLLSGCSSLAGLLDPPNVSLTNVTLVQANLLEQRYRLTLRVQNPNSIAIPISSIDYAVKLAGVDFANGVTPNSFRVPARGEGLVDIEVSTNLLVSARQIYTILQNKPDNLDYQISGNIGVDLPRVKAIPFSRSGQVSLNGLNY